MKVIATEKAPAAIGPYSQAMVSNGVVYTSGQIAIDPAVGDVTATTIEGQAEQVMKNLGEVLKAAGVTADTEELMKTTGIGSVLYAKRPGDGSAREYAASCQKVLGGLANICIEYATKRYRSNCVNWGILPFTNPDKEIVLEPGEYVYLPGIRKAVEEGATKVTATVIGTDGSTRPMELELKNVTEAEKKVLLAGSLINFYKEEK